MSAAVLTHRVGEPSSQSTGRVAGVFYLLVFVTGLAALMTDSIVVANDAAATAANIRAHELLFRLAAASNLVATACYIVVTALFYKLFAPVNRSVSLAAAFFSLVGCALGAISSLFQFAPLTVLGGAKYLDVFNPGQLQALSLLFLKVSARASAICLGFFGFYCLLIGYLILRSRLMPRVVGALMAFGGIGWLVSSFASLLSPPLAAYLGAWSMAPGILGEAAVTLWLLVAGINVQRWHELTAVS